jgi:glycosyltransferase involved in cell wall biosynthesis
MSDTSSQAILLTTDFPPMSGGIAGFLHGLWDELATSLPATVLSTVPAGTAPRPHRYRLEILEAVGAPGLTTSQRLLRMRGEAVPATLAHLKAAGADALVFIGVWSVMAHHWCQALQKSAIPYAIFAHDGELTDAELYASVDPWRQGDVRAARFLLANSRDTATRLRMRYGETLDIRVLNPGVPDRPVPETLRPWVAALKADLQLDGGRVLLTVARLERSKGIDLVIRCLPDLARAFPGLRYLVAGEGPEREALESLARSLGVAPLVTFLGRVDELCKQALYDLCEVYVMPSRLVPGRPLEGFGIVFLEAAVAARPCVAGRVGGTADAVVDGVTGLRVDSSDPRETLAALDRLLRDGALRLRLGEAGRERVRRHFLWPAVAGRFLRETGLGG